MYTAAVIGCGRIGTEFDDKELGYVSTHASAYQWHPEVELVGLCDIDGIQLEYARNKFAVPGWKDYKDMIDATSPDIVSICTPANTHSAVLFELLEISPYISTIFCEKPLAMTSAVAYEMVEACKEADVNLVVNYTRAFLPFTYDVADYIQKELGRIRYMDGKYSGGVFNNGTHMIELMSRFAGTVIRLMGMDSPESSGKPHDPNINGMLLFNNSISAALRSYTEPVFSLHFECENGNISLIDGALKANHKVNGKMEELFIPGDSGRRELIIHPVVNIVAQLSGELDFLMCTGAHGAYTVDIAERLVMSAKESAEYQRRVKWS